MVYSLAKQEQGESFSDGEAHQWDKRHIFDDRRRFCSAMKNHIIQKYTNLIKGMADALAACLSPMDPAWVWPKLDDVFFDSPLDNPLMVIDAVMINDS